MSATGDSDALLTSVLVVTHRRHEAFARGFESVLSATRGLPVEFVVVVNGVPIRSEHEAARSSGAKLLHPRANLGFAGGLHAARAAARGRYLAIVQDDVEVAAGWLEPLVETLEDDPAVGAVTSRVEFADGALQHEGWILWRDAEISGDGAGHRPGPRRAVDASGSASLLVRADAWDEVGGPNSELFPLGFVDLDLCLRLTRAGWTVMVEPRSVVRHDTHNRVKTRFRDYLDVRNGGQVKARFADMLDGRPSRDVSPEALVLQRLRCADEAERRGSTPRPVSTMVRSESTPMEILVRDARRQARSTRVGYLAWRVRGTARQIRATALDRLRRILMR